jgi:dynein heavy chain, axonemal
MVCLAANGVWWTAETEETFVRIRKGNKRAMKEHLQQQNEQLDGLVVKVRQGKWLSKITEINVFVPF